MHKYTLKFCPSCGVKSTQKQFCADCGKSYKKCLEGCLKNLPKTFEESCSEDTDNFVPADKESIQKKRGPAKKLKKELKIKVNLFIGDKKQTSGHRYGGGCKSINFDTSAYLITYKQIFSRILQIYFPDSGTVLGSRSDYIITILNSCKQPIVEEKFTNLDDYMTENGLAFNATLFYLNLTKIVMPVVNKSSRNAPKTIIKSTKNGGKTIPISRDAVLTTDVAGHTNEPGVLTSIFSPQSLIYDESGVQKSAKKRKAISRTSSTTSKATTVQLSDDCFSSSSASESDDGSANYSANIQIGLINSEIMEEMETLISNNSNSDLSAPLMQDYALQEMTTMKSQYEYDLSQNYITTIPTYETFISGEKSCETNENIDPNLQQIGNRTAASKGKQIKYRSQ